MARTRRELNPDILRENMPDNYHNVLNQAERNVNNAVDVLIRGYEQNLNDLVKKLEDKKLSKDLQKKISDLQKNLETSFDDATNSAGKIKGQAENLEKKVKSGSALKDLAEELSTAAGDLQKLIDDARKKVQDVGDLSGQVLGTALRKFVAGGF